MNITEELFIKCLGHNYLEFKVEHSSKEEDMFEHWDIKIIYQNGSSITVDVKGAKKLRRSDPNPNYNIVYVELKNVRGDKGWLVGKADYIAFELKDTFIMVNRKRLLERTIQKIKYHFQSTPQPYYLYNRKGRKDVVTILPIEDILDIVDWEVKKAGVV